MYRYLVILLSLHLSIATAADWPQFRGSKTDGVSTETDWNTRLPKTAKIAWSKQIGRGFGAVSIYKGKACAVGWKSNTDTTFCFDAVTGEELWTHSYACGLHDNMHEGGPAASPAMDDEFVFTVSKEGHLFCLSATDGSVVWKKHFQDDYKVAQPEWGFAGSVIIDGERVLVDAGVILALDRKTGKEIWKSKKYPAAYGTPQRFSFSGKEYIATLNTSGLVIVESATGKEVAVYKWKTPYDTNATTPVIQGGNIFISTAYNKGCAMLRFDGKNLKVAYRNTEMRNHMDTSVLVGKSLYGFDRKAHNDRVVKFTCMDMETGKVRWRQGGLGVGTVVAAGNALLVLSSKGVLLTVEPTPESYKELSRTTVLSGRCWTAPTLANGLIYCRNATGDLAVVDVRN